MTTVPAHNFSAPARAWVMAAARFMPDVWAVLMSSSLERTTRTPSSRHRASLPLFMATSPRRVSEPRLLGAARALWKSIGKEADRTAPVSRVARRRRVRAAGDGSRAAVDYSMTDVSPATAPTRLTARALIVGERIDTAGLERPDMISSLPLAFRVGERGIAALFRFGVAVMVGLSPLEEEDLLAKLRSRVSGFRALGDDETAVLEITPDSDEQKSSSGPIQIKNLSPPRFLVIADAPAKPVARARDEREVNAVSDVVEPFAAKLAATGRPPFRRRAMLRLIGQALLAQHRVSGRVAVEEKPDVLWDHPELERLYARLADEYELTERADVLKRKLEVIGDTAQALTDIIDADRATRLEAAIVILIVLELIAAIVQIALALRGR